MTSTVVQQSAQPVKNYQGNFFDKGSLTATTKKLYVDHIMKYKGNLVGNLLKFMLKAVTHTNPLVYQVGSCDLKEGYKWNSIDPSVP